MDAAEIAQVIEGFRALAILVELTAPPRVIKDDADDDKFLACAVAGGADFVVSGDKHLLALGQYDEIPILTPAAFLAVFWKEGEDGP